MNEIHDYMNYVVSQMTFYAKTKWRIQNGGLKKLFLIFFVIIPKNYCISNCYLFVSKIMKLKMTDTKWRSKYGSFFKNCF